MCLILKKCWCFHYCRKEDRHLQFFCQLAVHHKFCLFQRRLFVRSVQLRLFQLILNPNMIIERFGVQFIGLKHNKAVNLQIYTHL